MSGKYVFLNTDPSVLDVLADTTSTSNGDALIGVKRTTAGALATTQHVANEGRALDTYIDYGLTPDGTTDRTAALTSVLSTLSAASYKGWLHIPYGTKFTISTVYAAVPIGMVLDDESSINWNVGSSTGRYKMMYSGDNASNDTQEAVASGHHPARFYFNFGTAGTASATSRLASEIFAIGVNYAGNPLTTLLRQHKKDGGGNKWMWSYRLQTPYSVAIANPQNWVTGHVYAAGAYVISDSDKVYTTVAGGTSGSTAPTGTGSGINDGGVLWNYVQSAINIDSTIREEDEQGNVRQFGVPLLSSSFYHYWDHNGTRVTLTVDGTSHDVTYSDLTRGTFIKLADTTGVQLDGMRSFNWQTVSGATPTLSTSYAYVNNGGATTMTNMSLPTSQTQGYVRMLFANGNTTIQNNANITLKGAVNVTPTTGQSMEFVKFTSLSSAWIEISRSF